VLSEGELETDMSSVEFSVVLSSDFGLQDENNTAMLNSRKKQVNKTLILFLKKLLIITYS